MSIKTTINDIAAFLHNTPAAVFRALNNHLSISDKIKKTILEVVLHLSYKRNTIASSFRHGKKNITDLIVPDAGINFFGPVLHSIESVANRNTYNCLISQSNEQNAFRDLLLRK